MYFVYSKGDKMLILDVCENLSILGVILFIKNLLKIICVVVPILLLLFLIIDFVKATMENDSEKMSKVKNTAIKRIVYAILVFLVPAIVNGFMSLLGDSTNFSSCYDAASSENVQMLAEANKLDEEIQKAETEEKRLELIERQSQLYEKINKNIPKPKQNNSSTEPKQNNSSTDVALQPWFDALEEQYKWAKKSKYGWIRKPTVENSKTKGTCATYVLVSMQRAGLLPSGMNIFSENHGTYKITASGKRYIRKHSDMLSYSYVDSTPKKLYNSGKLKPGDILTFKFWPNGHTMVFVGKDKKGNFLWDTGGSTKCINCKMNSYLNRKVNIIIRVKSVK